jgi:hypothetical protein
MKNLIALALLLFTVGSVHAASGQQVQLPASLIFHSPGQPDIAMPYDRITQFGARQQVAHHLGVVTFIVVGMVRARQQRHFLTVAFTDTQGAAQVSTFEVNKDLPDLLLPVLEIRAVNACERRAEFGSCAVAPAHPRPLTPR